MHFLSNHDTYFRKLPGTISGCQFGMINVSKNKEIVRTSKDTIAPITYVPYIILYHNGRPYMRYDGPANQNDIQNFIVEVANSLQTRQSFTNEQKKITLKKKLYLNILSAFLNLVVEMTYVI